MCPTVGTHMYRSDNVLGDGGDPTVECQDFYRTYDIKTYSARRFDQVKSFTVYRNFTDRFLINNKSE